MVGRWCASACVMWHGQLRSERIWQRWTDADYAWLLLCGACMWHQQGEQGRHFATLQIDMQLADGCWRSSSQLSRSAHGQNSKSDCAYVLRMTSAVCCLGNHDSRLTARRCHTIVSSQSDLMFVEMRARFSTAIHILWHGTWPCELPTFQCS